MSASILAIALALPGVARPLAAQSTPAPLFSSRDLLYAGGVALGVVAVSPFDKRFAEYLQGSPQTNRFFSKTAAVVRTIAEPGAYIIGGGLYALGKLSKSERMADLGLHGSESILVGLGVTGLLKYGAGRARPCVVDSAGQAQTIWRCLPGVVPKGYAHTGDPRSFQLGRGFRESAFRSFPSGHTLIAFAAATAVTDETRRWWPNSVWYIAPAMYGGATLVGVSRMYNNRHWASDVLMGGAIGAFTARKVVRWHHEHPGNNLDRWLLGVTIRPGPDGRMTEPFLTRTR